jgi:serine/threonine protein kinase
MFFNLNEVIEEVEASPWRSAWRVESFLASGRHFRHYHVRSLAPELEGQRAVLKVIKYDPRRCHDLAYVQALRARLRRERDTLAHFSPRLPEPLDFFLAHNPQDPFEGFGGEPLRQSEPVMVRTRLHGVSLAQLMESQGAPPAPAEALLLALARLCGFLDELHAGGRGWLFWSLTPDHVIVDPEQSYEPCFTGCSNFRMMREGFAVAPEEELALGPAAAHPEPGYAAPEALCGELSGVGADLYGLGALLFHLFSGIDPRSLAEELWRARGLHELSRPLDADEAEALCAALRDRLEHLCQRNLKGLGMHRARIRRLLLRLLDPDPAQRGRSPLEARDEILSCLSRSMPRSWR